MISLAAYGLIGCALVALAFMFWRLAGREAWEAPIEPLLLPARAVVDRIFSADDLAYARSQPRFIRRTFERERRSLARRWIRQIREAGIGALRSRSYGMHKDSESSPKVELRLLSEVALILLMCETLSIAVALFGVFRTKAMISLLASRTEVLRVHLEVRRLGNSYEAA